TLNLIRIAIFTRYTRWPHTGRTAMLKKFKSLFVIEEPKKEGAASGAETARESGPTPRSRPVMSAVAGTAEAGQIQDKLLDVLFGALEESNLEGFDYMEFKDFLKSLANVPMDDATRFKSAFATAQTMGATKEVILKSANHYLEVLAREEAKFQEALTARRETDLTGKQDQIKGLEEEIRTK